MLSFATLAEVKQFMQIQADTDDAFLFTLLKNTTKIIQNAIGRKIFSDTFTELISGDGKSHDLILEQYPIISVTSIHDDLDRVFGDGTLLVEDTGSNEGDYRIVDKDDVDGENPGIIRRLDGNIWQRGDKNIKVVYVAGYATGNIPADLAQAQIDFVSYIFNNKDMRSGIKSYKLGQFSVAYDNSASGRTQFRSIPDSVWDILMMYKNTNIGSTEDLTGV